MHKIIKWLTPVISVGVAIFIVYFLISINSVDVTVRDEPLSLKNDIKKDNTQKSWLSHFSQSKKLGYSYPVNEIYLKVDLNEKITKNITYKLSVNIQDPYQLFCLKEELRRYHLKYFLQKNKRSIYLLIYSRDVNRLNNLVKVLQNYKIKAHVELYKKD